MRVLHIDTGQEMRGGQHQTLLLMSGLRAAGHQNVLLARTNRPLDRAARSAGFEVYPPNILNTWRFAEAAEIVHAHDARAHTHAALGTRRPFVVSRQVAFRPGTSPVSRWKYRRAKRFLAVSTYVAEQLEAAGVPSESIDIVHDAVEPAPTGTFWTKGGPAIALATSDPQKGRNIIEQAAGKAAILVRFSTHLRQDLAGASMFVYISRSEGFGSAALLAMSMGIPVIASRVGGLPEVVEDGVTGLLVANDPEEVAGAMNKLFAASDYARRLGEAGRARANAEFTVHHLVNATLATYRRALDA